VRAVRSAIRPLSAFPLVCVERYEPAPIRALWGDSILDQPSDRSTSTRRDTPSAALSGALGAQEARGGRAAPPLRLRAPACPLRALLCCSEARRERPDKLLTGSRARSARGFGRRGTAPSDVVADPRYGSRKFRSETQSGCWRTPDGARPRDRQAALTGSCVRKSCTRPQSPPDRSSHWRTPLPYWVPMASNVC
jgi:hypothetical protein